MRTCKETTELLTKAAYSRLSPGERLSVRLHLMICRLCRDHHHQAEIVSQATGKLLAGKQRLMQLSDSARQRICQAIKKEQPRDD